ncbi:hypothetical protein BJ508DRAFT_83712 [Ascobolus immersus RN42]|uniref:Uncharacterized protein n=1 Tax=Ascobolus immersus RN42 TaxID=1160509 RepID=A0A3N4IEW8_ASCIM|nr:hypothetical protein BJ508DRAFT_83712 [Ascobolus immersus RN42]
MPRSKHVEKIPFDLLNKINAHREELYRLPEYQQAPVPAIKASTFLTKTKRASNRRNNNTTSKSNNSSSSTATTLDLSLFQHDEMAKNAAKALLETPWTEEAIRERLHNARSVSPEADVSKMGNASQLGAASEELVGMDIDTASDNSASHTTGLSPFTSPSSEEPTQQKDLVPTKPTTSISRSTSSNGQRQLLLTLKVSKSGVKKTVSSKKKKTISRSVTPQPITAPHPATKRAAPSTRSTSSSATRSTISSVSATATAPLVTTTAIPTNTQTPNIPVLNTSLPRPKIRLHPMSYFDTYYGGHQNQEVNSSTTSASVSAN